MFLLGQKKRGERWSLSEGEISSLISENTQGAFLRIIAPVASILAKAGVHPNFLSVAGLVISAITGVVYARGSFLWGACLLVLAGICDVLDGQIARLTHKASPFGAFLDSCLDRFGEVFVFAGLAWYFSANQAPWTVFFVVLGMGGSLLVSYTRSRAEGLGVDCKVGWMQRPERVTLLAGGSLLGAVPDIGLVLVKGAIVVLAVFSNLTAVQRIRHVRRMFSPKGQQA